MTTIQNPTSEVKHAAANPELELLERVGYVVPLVTACCHPMAEAVVRFEIE